MINITTVSKEKELLEILKIQKNNHKGNISEKEALDNGFLSVLHTSEALNEMNRAAPQIIALDGDKVAGFALVMLKSFSDRVPELIPLFEMLDHLTYKGKPVKSFNFYIMGQICIAEEYRGKGLFELLYQKHKELHSPTFDFCLTEVAVRNVRSMRAHLKTGFESIATYKDSSEEWNIMIWNWR